MRRWLLHFLLVLVPGVGLASAQGLAPLGLGGTPDPGSRLIPQSETTITYVDSQENQTGVGAAVNLLDGNKDTVWHTVYSPQPDQLPHTLVFDLGGVYSVDGWQYLPRQDGSKNGTITAYFLYTSLTYSADMPEEDWQLQMAGQLASTPTLKVARFAPVKARFVRVMAMREATGNPWSSGAEMQFWGILAQKLVRYEVSWQPPGEATNLTGYLVSRRAGPCNAPPAPETMLTKQPLPPAQRLYIDTDPPPGNWCYRTRAVYTCTGNCSGEIAEADITTLPK